MEKKLDIRFRQVHLDFHTSPLIPGIGAEFDKKQWQENLKMAHVDSITCFSCCHHGWSYHPTEVGAMHPELSFDLLREQMEASHEIGIKVPIYLTAGINNRIAELNPGWREINFEGQLVGWTRSPLKAGFKTLCFNTPYLDFLARLTEEAARLFPDADGMFFDIISQNQCCCPCCMRDMGKMGFDPAKEEDRKHFSDFVLRKYFKKITEAARSVNSNLNVFHNFAWLGDPGNEDVYNYVSHIESESLPTTGFTGYDAFPMRAAFSRGNKEKALVGMTGKFHTHWGEFGGFKSADALRYECAAMIAQGAACSIGDQLHPCGKLDESTYKLIGKAYREVEEKEPWCRNAQSSAFFAVLSSRWFKRTLVPDRNTDLGIARILREGHIPFDMLRDIDAEKIFRYKVLILADEIRLDEKWRANIREFLANGGKIILSGESLLKKEEDIPAFDIGICEGESTQYPNYIQAEEMFAPQDIHTPFVMYVPSMNFRKTKGESLGKIFEPYFVRSYEHFCSHAHTPFKTAPSGYDAGTVTENILYFAHKIFRNYALYGNVILKDFILKCIYAFAGDEAGIRTNLPSTARVTLMQQKEEKRYIAHALYANIIPRGTPEGHFTLLIDEIIPLYHVEFSFTLPEKIKKVTLEPEGKEIPFTEKEGKILLILEKLDCHAMMVLHY